MQPKVVPASGERDKQGRKKPPPRKYKGPFNRKTSTLKQARNWSARTLKHMEDHWQKKILDRTGDTDTATARLTPVRTLNRLLHNMTEAEFKEIGKRGFSDNDYQGSLF